MTIQEMLKEFSKGCSNGAPGECEECLEGAATAISIRAKRLYMDWREPTEVDTGPGSTAVYPGMTLRDYFAAKALSGLSADPDANVSMSFKQMAEWAYNMADAMLAVQGEDT